MRALVQRVAEAEVTVSGRSTGRIGPGLLVLVCAMQGDDAAAAEKLAARVAKLRIFRDAADKMNLSVQDVGGAVLVVSQFTLAADTRTGNRPGFSSAAPPPRASDCICISPRRCAILGFRSRRASSAPTCGWRWSMTGR